MKLKRYRIISKCDPVPATKPNKQHNQNSNARAKPPPKVTPIRMTVSETMSKHGKIKEPLQPRPNHILNAFPPASKLSHNILSKKHYPPAYIGNRELPPSPPDTLSPGTKFDHNIRILIVEDIAYNRTLLVNMLENIRYTRIDEAVDGQQAFQLVERARKDNDEYSVMLLDLRMPVMDGYDVIKAMTARGWDLPKIVVVTASVMDDDRDRCKEVGIQYFITKPISLPQLKDVMLCVTERH